ncbi:hypothetical protein KF840_21320 [bacterium]|nr:hypothetical protein [bacterium]
MPTIQLTYRGLCTRVEGADADELAWLTEFLSPAFGRDDAAPADCVVAVEDDAARLARLRAVVDDAAPPALCLVQDTGPICLPARHDAERSVVRHDDAQLAYVASADRRRIAVVAARRHEKRRTALMKLVRELAMSAAWSRDSLVLHAAAGVAGGSAILIAGPKRAGKSSLLLHLLRAPGARLLSNDRTVLALADEGTVAHGMPTIVNLRPDTVGARFADDAARGDAYRHRFALTVAEAAARPPVAAPADRPLSCSPPQLAHLLGIDLVGQAPAGVLLLPRVDPTARGIALQRLSTGEAADRLAEVLFAAHSGPRISEVFALPDRSRAPRPAELAHLWRACVERLRVFACRLGPDAYAGDATSLLARLRD